MKKRSLLVFRSIKNKPLVYVFSNTYVTKSKLYIHMILNDGIEKQINMNIEDRALKNVKQILGDN